MMHANMLLIQWHAGTRYQILMEPELPQLYIQALKWILTIHTFLSQIIGIIRTTVKTAHSQQITEVIMMKASSNIRIHIYIAYLK